MSPPPKLPTLHATTAAPVFSGANIFNDGCPNVKRKSLRKEINNLIEAGSMVYFSQCVVTAV